MLCLPTREWEGESGGRGYQGAFLPSVWSTEPGSCLPSGIFLRSPLAQCRGKGVTWHPAAHLVYKETKAGSVTIFVTQRGCWVLPASVDSHGSRRALGRISGSKDSYVVVVLARAAFKYHLEVISSSGTLASHFASLSSIICRMGTIIGPHRVIERIIWTVSKTFCTVSGTW